MLACISFLRISRGGCFSCHKIHTESSRYPAERRLLGNLSRVSGMHSDNISESLDQIRAPTHSFSPFHTAGTPEEPACPWLLNFSPCFPYCVHRKVLKRSTLLSLSYFNWCLPQRLRHCSSPFTKREHKCWGCFTLVQGYPLPSALSRWKLISLSLLFSLRWHTTLSGSKASCIFLLSAFCFCSLSSCLCCLSFVDFFLSFVEMAWLVENLILHHTHTQTLSFHHFSYLRSVQYDYHVWTKSQPGLIDEL